MKIAAVTYLAILFIFLSFCCLVLFDVKVVKFGLVSEVHIS